MRAHLLLAVLLFSCDPPKDGEGETAIPDDTDTAVPDTDDSGDTDDTAEPALLGSASATATTLLDGAELVSFGMPIPRGDLEDVSGLRLDVDGVNVPFQAAEVFAWYSADGEREGVRVALVQVDAAWMSSDAATLEISWGEGLSGEAPGADVVDPQNDEISDDVEETVEETTRTIAEVDGEIALVEAEIWTTTLYSARQPRVLVALDPEAWTRSEALSRTPRPAEWEALGMGGLSPLGDALSPYMRSAAMLQDYRLNPAGTPDPADPLQWEFGRCTTMIQAAVLTDDPSLLEESHRICAWYIESAEAWAAALSLWTLNDPVSGLLFHSRDLFEYATISGDWSAVETHRKVAQVWLEAPMIVAYRGGLVDGEDWMEQIVGNALEGLWYGWLATGDPELFTATEELVAALHTHTTGSDEELAAMGVGFPSQGCLVHSSAQAGESEDEDVPWCSPWQTATMVGPLLAWRDLTGDPKVDEILVALGRFLRDTGTAYVREEHAYCDAMMEPATCFDAAEGAPQRLLAPLYGAGIDPDGERVTHWNYGDFTHCPDVSALAAASYAAMIRRPDLDQGAVGPFESETESLRVLHQELAVCAAWSMDHYHRERRNPDYWTSALLEPGLEDPATFIATYKIGYPDYVNEPLRQASWWFNAGLEQVAELLGVGASVDTLEAGTLNPEECADTGLTLCP